MEEGDARNGEWRKLSLWFYHDQEEVLGYCQRQGMMRLEDASRRIRIADRINWSMYIACDKDVYSQCRSFKHSGGPRRCQILLETRELTLP